MKFSTNEGSGREGERGGTGKGGGFGEARDLWLSSHIWSGFDSFLGSGPGGADDL